MTIIGSLRDAVTAAGGTPSSYNKVALLRQLVTALGGTPTKRDVIGLLRQAVTAAGGTPTKYAEVYLLRELLVALGATAATFILYKLYEQLATAAAGGGNAPTLGTLTLSGTLTNGSSSSGTITGATAGSTIASNVTGLSVNSGARTYAWDGTGAAGSTSNGLVETLGGATNSPHDSSITVAAAASGITAPVLAIPAGRVANSALIPDITFDSTVSAGMYLAFEMAGNSGFTTPLGAEGAIRSYGPVLLTSDDLVNGPLIPILANQPTGTIYERMKITSDEPADSGWSNVISAAVVAQVNQFTFTDVTNATLSTDYTSNTLTMSGLSGSSAAYSVSGGLVSKNGGSFSGSSGTVVDGDTLRVKVTSSGSLSTAVNCTLTVGAISDTYTVTTVASASVWTYNAAPVYQSIGYAVPTATFTNEAFLVGTGIVAVGSQGRVITGVTVGGNAATQVAISDAASNDAVSLWSIAISSAGNYSVVVSSGGGALKDVGIATGTLAASLNPVPTATVVVANGYLGDPQTTPSITIPSGGVAICIVGSDGNGSAASWVAGTSNTEQHSAVNGDISFATASRTTAGAFQFQVNNYNYAGSGMVAAAWGP